MSITNSRLLASATLAGAATLWFSPAFAHAVCGDRIFPATLAIDDPGVGDELALPTVTYLPQNSDGAQEVDTTFSWTKTLLPNVGLTFGDGPTWQKFSGSSWANGYGWESLDTELQWGNFCWPDQELMATLGFDVSWGRSGTGAQYAPFNTYTPVIDVGKGFGDLPKSLNILRPIALTGELSESFPGQSWTNGNPNATTLNWGLSIQYSLPYYNSQVGEIDSDFLKHLIPLAEFTFSKPIVNVAPGPNPTTGTFQPGVIYMADKWQFALEAVVPVNSASGRGVGVVGEMHFFFDDMFPNTLGKPIFTGGQL